MTEPSPLQTPAGSAASPSSAGDTPAIEARDLRLVRGGTTILDGLTCSIPAGQCTAILGPNGCGKTSFVRTLLGYLFPTAGHLAILGQTLGQTNVPALRQRIGLVNVASAGGAAAGVVDADLSATDAVCTGYFATIGLYDAVSASQRDRARHLLDLVGLGHRLDHRFALLSTGEQRRALLARALVHFPELLILDEPTAGLDIAGREHLLATLESILATPGAPALLMITHHVEDLSPRTSQVLLMKHGRFIHSGPPQAMLTPERLTETFGCKVYVRRLHGRYWLEVLPEAWLDLLPKA